MTDCVNQEVLNFKKSMGEKGRKQNFIAKPKQPNTTYCPKEKCSDNVGQKEVQTKMTG